MPTVMERIRTTIEEMRMIQRGDGVVVGISGGPDSTLLLHALHLLSGDLGFWIAAVHVDHGLRGEESSRDALFAKGQAERLGVPRGTTRMTASSGF